MYMRGRRMVCVCGGRAAKAAKVKNQNPGDAAPDPAKGHKRPFDLLCARRALSIMARRKFNWSQIATSWDLYWPSVGLREAQRRVEGGRFPLAGLGSAQGFNLLTFNLLTFNLLICNPLILPAPHQGAYIP